MQEHDPPGGGGAAIQDPVALSAITSFDHPPSNIINFCVDSAKVEAILNEIAKKMKRPKA